MESIADLWFNAWMKHLHQMWQAQRLGQPTEGFGRAALIANMEYVTNTALEMVEARKP